MAPDLSMATKVLRLHEALDGRRIPHAFGGAIAVDYYRVPRATIDIDLNLFVPPDESQDVLDAFAEVFRIPDPEALSDEIREREQGKTYWGSTRIDLFFAGSEFHESMSARTREVAYEQTTIPILSAEDIVLVKALFDRTQDWADIEAVCGLMGPDLDLAYIKSWLEPMVGLGDPRAQRLVRLASG